MFRERWLLSSGWRRFRRLRSVPTWDWSNQVRKPNKVCFRPRFRRTGGKTSVADRNLLQRNSQRYIDNNNTSGLYSYTLLYLILSLHTSLGNVGWSTGRIVRIGLVVEHFFVGTVCWTELLTISHFDVFRSLVWNVANLFISTLHLFVLNNVVLGSYFPIVRLRDVTTRSVYSIVRSNILNSLSIIVVVGLRYSILFVYWFSLLDGLIIFSVS